jgi:hypothetical protein
MDGDKALIAFAEAEGIEDELIIASKGEHVHEKVLHIQISAKLPRLAPLAGKGRENHNSTTALAAALGSNLRRTQTGPRQKLDLDRAEFRAKGEEFQRAQVLGVRIFRLDGGPGREDDPRLHQELAALIHDSGFIGVTFALV